MTPAEGFRPCGAEALAEHPRGQEHTPRRGIGGHGTGERHGDEPLVDSDCTGSAAL